MHIFDFAFKWCQCVQHHAEHSLCSFSTDPTEQTRTTVASVSESVCRPLRTRIEQMIVTDQRREGGKKPVMLYKISNLLRFYHNTIMQVIVSTALLHTLISFLLYPALHNIGAMW